MRSVGRTPAFLALLLLFACTSGTGPESFPSVTLLVTNATCASGQCSSFQVRGFTDVSPTVPAGPPSLDLGTVSGEFACLTVPAADTFWVNDSASLWTSRDPLSLGIQEPGQFWGHVGPSTAEFKPATSEGWSVTLPGGTAVAMAGPCG